MHQLLFRRTDRRGSLKLQANALALEIGLSPYHFSRIMAEFQEDGRMREVARAKHNVRTYMVTDPAIFQTERQTFRDTVASAQTRFASA